MIDPRRVVVAGLLALLPQHALAVDSSAADQAQSVQKTLSDYLVDLSSDNAATRLYAVRVVHGNVRRTTRLVERGRPGTFAVDEARAQLVELADRVPAACIADLVYPNCLGPCADMLGWLGVKEAAEPLRQALQLETRPAVQRRVQAALDAIAAAP